MIPSYTKGYKLQKKEAKEIDFSPDPERLKVDYLDIFEGVKSQICIQPSMIRIVLLAQPIWADQT